MITFNEALQTIQEANKTPELIQQKMPAGWMRGVKICPKCNSQTGKDDDGDYGDCECGYREKKALGKWKFNPDYDDEPKFSKKETDADKKHDDAKLRKMFGK